jgi:PST family polysaccharide transporter
MGSVLNSVVVPILGRLRHSRQALQGAITTATQLVALLALPIGTLSIALAAPIVNTLFGHKWSEAAPVLAILAAYGVLYSFSLLFVNILVAVGSTGALLLVQVAWVAVLVPGIVLGVDHRGLQGVAWAHLMTVVAVAVPAYLLASVRSTGLSATALLRVVAGPTAAAAAAGACAWLVAQAFGPQWAQLLGGGLAGAVVYIALVARAIAHHIPDHLLPQWLPARWRGTARLPATGS